MFCWGSQRPLSVVTKQTKNNFWSILCSRPLTCLHAAFSLFSFSVGCLCVPADRYCHYHQQGRVLGWWKLWRCLLPSARCGSPSVSPPLIYFWFSLCHFLPLLTLLCLPIANKAKPCRSLLKLFYVCSPGLLIPSSSSLFLIYACSLCLTVFYPSQPHSLSCSLSLSLISLFIYTDLITRTFFKASFYKALEWKVHSLLFELTSLLHSSWPSHGFSTWLLVHPMSCSLSLT